MIIPEFWELPIMSRVSKISFFLLAGVVFAGPALADVQLTPTFKVGGDVKAQYQAFDNYDLGTASEDPTHISVMEAKMRAAWQPYDWLSFYTEGRGVKGSRIPTRITDDETGTPSTARDYLELRQFWGKTEFHQLPNWNLQFGRQRIRENRGFWWNRDIDAVRTNFDYTLMKGFVALAEDQAAYTTAKPDQPESEDGRLRLLVENSYQYQPDHFVEGRLAFERDHTDREAVNGLVKIDDEDREDLQLNWAGVRFTGKTLEQKSLGYRVDLAGVWGTIEQTNSTTGTNSGNRRISSHSDLDVRGWAMDSELTYQVKDMQMQPTFLAGYAYGSGDDATVSGTSHAFRQTGLQGNQGRLGGSGTTVRSYGEVLNPELTNLHILTAGVTVPVLISSDISVFYHDYYLVNKDGQMRSADISASLDGSGSHVGQALDVIGNFNVDKELGVDVAPLRTTNLRFSVGAFQAGTAYIKRGEDDVAFRGLMEFRVGF
jgi:alginate production protein